jgi:hypothetical protein
MLLRHAAPTAVCAETMTENEKKAPNIHAVGLDVHGAEPVSHAFTIPGADGNGDIELNFVLPLTPTRHKQLVHMLEEGYSEHEAYVLLAGGEILAHIEAMKKAKRESR